MNYEALYPSKYLKAADLEGSPVTVVIEKVVEEEMQDGEVKPVLHFQGAHKAHVMPRINGRKIAELVGSNETREWAGKAITLYPSQTEMGGKMVDCVRIRAAGTNPGPSTPAASVLPVPPPTAAAPSSAPPPTNVTTKGAAWAVFTAWYDRQNAAKPGSFTNEQLVAGWTAAMVDVGKPESEFVATDWAWMATCGVETLEIPF